MDDNRYTDNYTKTFDIRIGKRVEMPPEECNWSTQDCATAGLHWTMDQIHQVGMGDTSIIVLINPMKVVGVGAHKGRTYEYLPIATISKSEATKFLRSGDFNSLDIEDKYAEEELVGLEQRVRENFAVEAKKYSFNMPAISSEEVKRITISLGAMQDELLGRVSTLKNKVPVYGVEEDGYSGYDEDDDYNWDDEDEDF